MTQPYLGRLHESLKCHASWCSTGNYQYWQVDMGRELRLSHVATQGAVDGFGYVKTYKLELRYASSASFLWYEEGNTIKVCRVLVGFYFYRQHNTN